MSIDGNVTEAHARLHHADGIEGIDRRWMLGHAQSIFGHGSATASSASKHAAHDNASLWLRAGYMRVAVDLSCRRLPSASRSKN